MRDLELRGFSDVRRLGSGGIGDVYRATRTSTRSTVAIKLLRDWSDHGAARNRAQRELSALLDLRGHANVVNVEEVIEIGGQLALVMEHAPGGSVVDLQRRCGGALGLAETLLIATDTAAALAAAHERGIIHRDIKPHNLLIGAFGNVKVCDFGIAALTRTEEHADRTSSLSLRYASPEELRGDAEVGPSADIYSLGATIHQLLTATYLPPPDGTAGSVPLRNWTSPTDLPAHDDLAIRDLVARCAARNPANRPSAAELFDRFDELAGRLGPLRCRALPVGDDADATKRAANVGPAVAEVAMDATGVMSHRRTVGASTSSVDQTTAIAGEASLPESTSRRGMIWPLVLFGLGMVFVVAVLAVFGRGNGSTSDDAPVTSEVTGTTLEAASTTEPGARTAPAVDSTIPPTTAPAVDSTIPPTTALADVVLDELTTASLRSSTEIAVADRFNGLSFEAVDGIGYNPIVERYFAIRETAPDEVAEEDDARSLPTLFYFFPSDPDEFPTDPDTSAIPIRTIVDADGEPYAFPFDVEGAAALGDGSLVFASNGLNQPASNGEPFVDRLDAEGRFISTFALPSWLAASVDGTSGARLGGRPQGIAARPGTRSEAILAMRSALAQDDPGLIRLTSFDAARGDPTREWSYPIDSSSWIVAITSLADQAIVVLEMNTETQERSLYLVELDDGDEPGGVAAELLDKRNIVFDDPSLADVAWASITDGPRTAAGNATILLMTNSRWNDSTTVIAHLQLQ